MKPSTKQRAVWRVALRDEDPLNQVFHARHGVNVTCSDGRWEGVAGLMAEQRCVAASCAHCALVVA